MGREKAWAFISIGLIAIVVVIKNAHVLHTRGYLNGSKQKRERLPGSPERTVLVPEPVVKGPKVAICILTQRGAWERRHLVRQTWLQDVREGEDVSHIFVMGEDKSFTKAENDVLAKEVTAHRDILITREEEGPISRSAKTKHCLNWITNQSDFDILIKTDDDSTLFLSRLVGAEGWLAGVRRNDFVYFGKKNPLSKVSNPVNFNADEKINTLTQFEFDYRGVYWPEYMEGGMYGFSRRLAEEIVKTDFQMYTREDAMVGVWVSSFRVQTLYLKDEHVLQDENDYRSKNGTNVLVSFKTNRFRLASMWCEYGPLGTLSQRAMLADDPQRTLDCLGSYQRATLKSRSQPLGVRKKFQGEMIAMLDQPWPIEGRPELRETGKWWSQMERVFRGWPAVVIGNGAEVDRLPLYLLQGMHSLVFDDFFQVAERYASWAPTMYMCVDRVVCASTKGGIAARTAAGGRRATERSQQSPANVESANRFARDVFAAFFLVNSVDVEYWRYLRERVNVHWFVSGQDVEGRGRSDVAAAGMGPVVDGQKTTENFRVMSRMSGLAMGIEVLAHLGFAPIYVTGAREELRSQWDEVSRALHLASSVYGTEVIYLYGHEADRLENRMIAASANRDKNLSIGRLATQQNFVKGNAKLHGMQGEKLPKWEMDAFLRNFPMMSRLKVNREALSLETMFPESPQCRDAEDLDRFQKVVLCPVRISLEHFSSFLASHVPYGPVGDTFVWAKR